MDDSEQIVDVLSSIIRFLKYKEYEESVRVKYVTLFLLLFRLLMFSTLLRLGLLLTMVDWISCLVVVTIEEREGDWPVVMIGDDTWGLLLDRDEILPPTLEKEESVLLVREMDDVGVDSFAGRVDADGIADPEIDEIESLTRDVWVVALLLMSISIIMSLSIRQSSFTGEIAGLTGVDAMEDLRIRRGEGRRWCDSFLIPVIALVCNGRCDDVGNVSLL